MVFSVSQAFQVGAEWTDEYFMTTVFSTLDRTKFETPRFGGKQAIIRRLLTPREGNVASHSIGEAGASAPLFAKIHERVHEAYVDGYAFTSEDAFPSALQACFDAIHDVVNGESVCAHCHKQATHWCCAEIVPIALCEVHRREQHGGCNYVYKLRLLTVNVLVRRLEAACPDAKLLRGRVVHRAGSKQSVIVSISDDQHPAMVTLTTTTTAKEVKEVLPLAELLATATLAHAEDVQRYCVALMECFVTPIDKYVSVPLWGLFQRGEELATSHPELAAAFLPSPLQAAVRALLDNPSTDPASDVLSLLLKHNKALAYCPDIFTTRVRRVAQIHVADGDSNDLIQTEARLPIVFGPEVLGNMHFSSKSNPGHRIREWCLGDGFGVPVAYLSPPWCVSIFGVHVEQHSIESVNVLSAKSTHAWWSFANITDKNSEAMSSFQLSLVPSQRSEVYKGAMLAKAAMAGLGFDPKTCEVVEQLGGSGIIARSYHWGIQTNKVAIAYQWMGKDWFIMDIHRGAAIPVAPIRM